jgi:hypothetical protein
VIQTAILIGTGVLSRIRLGTVKLLGGCAPESAQISRLRSGSTVQKLEISISKIAAGAQTSPDHGIHIDLACSARIACEPVPWTAVFLDLDFEVGPNDFKPYKAAEELTG